MIPRLRKSIYDTAYRRRYAGQGRDSVPVELTIQGTLGVDYIVTTTATRKFYRFINSSATPGSVTVSTATPATIEYVAIGGGGGGGASQGAGGGAGGLQRADTYTLPQGTHAITVGRGGAGGVVNGNTVVGNNGAATRLGTLVTALGGGYGGGSNDAPFFDGSRSSIAGAVDVGCGGGGKGFVSGLGGIGSQGSNGGRGTANLGSYSGGGGGGVAPGGQGGDGSAIKGGDGGAGISYTIGESVLQIGGGGGGGAQNGATRGFGSFGGGNGNQNGGGAPGAPGQANTGGGGGGGAGGSLGGAGGTGILIISHAI
jgi:hypothetical protein